MNVLDGTHPAAWPIEELLKQCDFKASRASGPGGQHRNKVETAVTFTHRPTGIMGFASERREQAANRKVAIFRLRLHLALQIRMPRTEGQRPSALMQSRCRTGRLKVNTEHEDFPAILAEALDYLYAFDLVPSVVAKHLGCSSTKLVKLLQSHPPAMVQVNAAREIKGLHKLH